MTRSELAQQVETILAQLCGEQFKRWTDEDGDVHFGVCFMGVPVGLVVEDLWEGEALVAGHHVMGMRVQDREAAVRFVAERNQTLRIGRVEVCGDAVVFFHQLFEGGVNTSTVRHLLRLLASESSLHADLAAVTGAITFADHIALERLGD